MIKANWSLHAWHHFSSSLKKHLYQHVGTPLSQLHCGSIRESRKISCLGAEQSFPITLSTCATNPTVKIALESELPKGTKNSGAGTRLRSSFSPLAQNSLVKRRNPLPFTQQG
ncbi:hypothetical protein GOP47_0030943 [Adiantum capillus-veneris]|nr:hypothetical protein GOP47_0030943 [Adiantum capillus-veneris]